MRGLVLALVGALAVALEASVVPYVSVCGARPDIVLAYVVLIGMLAGTKEAALVGLVVGFFEDASSGQLIGLYMLTRMAVGLAAGLSHKRVFQERVVVPVALVFLGGLFGGAIHLFLLSSFGVPLAASPAALRMVAFQALYSAAIAPLVLRVIVSLGLPAGSISERRRAF